MRRVSVYVDGFNLYHAVDDLREDSLKWLCLRRLSQSIIGKNEVLGAVKYFSAFATWHPDGMARHKAYVLALGAEGVQFVPGQFKKKHCKCKVCRAEYQTHEEKETDVNIGIHLVRDTFDQRFERAILITADTDLRTAVEMAKDIDPKKDINVVAPPGRFNRCRALNPILELSKGRIRSSRLLDHYDVGGQRVECPPKFRIPAAP